MLAEATARRLIACAKSKKSRIANVQAEVTVGTAREQES